LLSSAILYVAIVAIWAGVLIPRWLRRDSAASERDREDVTTAEAEPEAEAEVVAQPAPPPQRREDTSGFERRPARHQEPTAPRAPVRPEARPQPQLETRAEVRAEGPGGPRDQEQKKVLAGRRRLLGMLLVLAMGSGVLAFTGMAAWWVIVPPTTMLLGYMGLLREAAKADAERRELARTRAAAAAVVAAARRDAPPATAAPAPPPPDAEVIDISASLTPAGQEFFDQYADAKLRAVGDLPIPGAAADPGESHPAVQGRGGRIVDVDVESDARLAAGPHAPHRFADQPGADVAATGQGHHAHLRDPAGGLPGDEPGICAVQGGEQGALRAEVLVLAEPLDPASLRPAGKPRTVAEGRLVNRVEPGWFGLTPAGEGQASGRMGWRRLRRGGELHHVLG
jgi:hypothetical protein